MPFGLRSRLLKPITDESAQGNVDAGVAQQWRSRRRFLPNFNSTVSGFAGL